MSDPVTHMIGYTIYTQAGRKCPWCEKAREALDTRGLPYESHALESLPLREVAGHANMSTVPIIYHGDELIGGYEELKKHLENGVS